MTCLLIIVWMLILLSIVAAFTNGHVLLGIFLVVVLLAAYAWSKHKSEEQQEEARLAVYKSGVTLDEVLANAGFDTARKLISGDHKTILAVDEESERICLVDNPDGISSWANAVSVYTRSFAYHEILEVEVIENGTAVTKTSRGSQVGGAVIGAVLAGGVGAIIGGLSASKETVTKVKELSLRIMVNDTKEPVFTVSLYTHPVGVSRETPAYKEALRLAAHWHGVLSVLLRRADAETNAPQQIAAPATSVADELVKLSDLVKAGIITTEEFERQKAKLLA